MMTGFLRDVPMATEPQIRYLTSLAKERVIPVDWSADIADMLAGEKVFTKRGASAAIDALKAAPKKQDESAEKEEIEAGMYRKDGVIYKVQRAVHGSGRMYAKKLVEDDTYSDDTVHWAFVYAPGAVKFLRPEHKMTLEEAKEFGALYGTCVVCGRTLTKEESIEAGIGPVCASKGGWA